MTGMRDRRSGAAARPRHRPHRLQGRWLALWLRRLGAEVTASRSPPTTPTAVPARRARVDDGERSSTSATPTRSPRRCARRSPEIVFHLAAQSLVRRGYREPVETFATNVMGTAHVLEALRGMRLRARVVVVTTDKVYENREWRGRTARTTRSAATIPTARARPRPSWSPRAIASAFLQAGRASPSPPRAPATSSAAATGRPIGWCPDVVRALSTGEPAARAPARRDPALAARARAARRLPAPGRGAVADAHGLADAWNFGPAHRRGGERCAASSRSRAMPTAWPVVADAATQACTKPTGCALDSDAGPSASSAGGPLVARARRSTGRCAWQRAWLRRRSRCRRADLEQIAIAVRSAAT